jgi:hypothetical protein
LFAREQAGKQALALLVIAHAQDRIDRKRRRREGNRGERPAQFAEHDRGVNERRTCPAVLR